MARKSIAEMSFSQVYPLLVQKAERKGRTRAEVDAACCWLTGYDEAGLARQLERGVTYQEFFDEAPALNPNRALITGKICSVDVTAIEDPVEQNAATWTSSSTSSPADAHWRRSCGASAERLTRYQPR